MWIRYLLYAALAAVLIVAGHFLEGVLTHPASSPAPDTPPACALEGFCAFHPIRVARATRPAASAPVVGTATSAAATPGRPSAHYHEETVAQLLGKGAGTSSVHHRTQPG